MSKYHKGDKFIVEIKEVIESDNGRLYRSDFKTLTFDDNGLDKLQKYNKPTISEDTLEMERMKALNEGRNEVWELAKKLWHNDAKTNDDIYGIEYFIDIANEYTPQEALVKLEAYEKSKEIKVGDIVKDGKNYFLVTKRYDNTFEGMSDEGYLYCGLSLRDCEKTGKHIDLTDIFKQIGGADD